MNVLRLALPTVFIALALPASASQTTAQQPISYRAADVSCDQPSPDWIFCEDFEDGNVLQWDQDDPKQHGTLRIVADSGEAATSNHVLQLRLSPGRGGVGLNKTFTPEQYDTLYARWYQQFEPGFDFKAPNHGHGFHAGDRWMRGRSGKRPQGDDYFTAQMEYLRATHHRPARFNIYSYYRGMTMDCRNPDGQCWGDHFPCMLEERYCKKRPDLKPKVLPPPLQAGRWYCVEMMVDAGDPVSQQALANGRMNFRVDGVSYGPWDNLWFRSDAAVKLNHFWLGLFHHQDHSAAGILYDNIVVSRKPIGCN